MIRRNVLIFHLGALGDFVVSWPLILSLGRLYPQSRIICITHGSKGKLVERTLRVESADIDGGAWHHLFGDPSALPEPSRRLIEGAHAIFSFIAAPDDAWCASVRGINPEAALIALQPRPPEGSPFAGHISQWIEDQLAGTPAVRGALQQILRSIQTRGVGVRRSPEGTICVHPGSGSARKNWPCHHFVQLVRKLVKTRHRVRVLVGEAERQTISTEDLAHFSAVAEVVEPRDYLDLLGQLSIADALVCNDTGPAHLAGIIGTPTFALFGPHSNAIRWKPLGPHIHLKEAADLAHLSVDDVFKWIQAAI